MDLETIARCMSLTFSGLLVIAAAMAVLEKKHAARVVFFAASGIGVIWLVVDLLVLSAPFRFRSVVVLGIIAYSIWAAYRLHSNTKMLKRLFPIKQYWEPHDSWLLEFPKGLAKFLRDERRGLLDELLEEIQNAVTGIGSCCMESGTFRNLDIYATNDSEGREKAERVAKAARQILWNFMQKHNLA